MRFVTEVPGTGALVSLVGAIEIALAVNASLTLAYRVIYGQDVIRNSM